jgi:hypothetical protein
MFNAFSRTGAGGAGPAADRRCLPKNFSEKFLLFVSQSGSYCQVTVVWLNFVVEL